MKLLYYTSFIILFFSAFDPGEKENAWIRINQLGYTNNGVKVAVWCGKEKIAAKKFQLVDASSKKIVFSDSIGKAFGAYGPFTETYRLRFTSFTKPGRYYLQCGKIQSPEFVIGNDVYKGSADFCLRYMRQQRSGFNPFLKDSCHTHDGYVLYGKDAGIEDSTHVDVSGGWHDASDYLQYSTTSANATYHLLMAYRDFRNVFKDEKSGNGLDGANGIADVLDEANWGLNWLLKMNPGNKWMFNQVADDRDHMGMRIPKEDSFYGKGTERPVYFVSGEPQQRGKFMNNTTGTSSTAAKFASAFALAQYIYKTDDDFKKVARSRGYYDKAFDAYYYAKKKPGVTQTASVRSPYIYAEENWVDDMELAAAAIHNMVDNDNGAYMLTGYHDYAQKEKITPWLGADTAKHYQWYPFINIGHYELIKQYQSRKKGPYDNYSKQFMETDVWKRADTLLGYYREGIERVWRKAAQNAFYRGIPFIWCSNNLTASFAIQCYWYRTLSGDKNFSELEQANFDWLFGCNPWGTSMVYGLPSWGDTPVDPHSAFTHLKNYPIDGGLVDGPVYGSIYGGLIGIHLKDSDEYADFQSNLAVYHDDYGDYSTNEPTMDGTASLIYLLAAKENETMPAKRFSYDHGGMIRGDSTKRQIALVFTGDEFADGGNFIAQSLQQQSIKASFFFTGNFYHNNEKLVEQLLQQKHFLGNHSMKHLLYCDWTKRDSLLVTKNEFLNDLTGLDKKVKNNYFLPPYEWHNDSISKWCKEAGHLLVNYTPGTLSNADYTTPAMKNYRSSEVIYNSIVDFEKKSPSGLNGFMLLLHIGTDSARTDKFYKQLPALISYLKKKQYVFVTVPELLK